MLTTAGAACIAACVTLGAAPPALATTAAPPAPSSVATAKALGYSGDDTLLVDGWYSDFLHYMATGDPGSQYWIDQLSTRQRADVLTQLLATPEHAARTSRGRSAPLVASWYRNILGRSAAPGEVAYWFDTEKTSDITAQTRIASSQEYHDIIGGYV